MKIYKTKNGNKTLVADLQQSHFDNTEFTFNPYDKRKFEYTAKLSSEELLGVVWSSLQRLSKLAGVEYGVFVKTKHSEWSKLN